MKFNEFIIKILSEDNGNPSSIRTFSAIIIFFFVIILTIGFAVVFTNYKELIIAYAGILSGLISAVLALKVWQKDKEGKNE